MKKSLLILAAVMMAAHYAYTAYQMEALRMEVRDAHRRMNYLNAVATEALERTR